MMLYSLRYLASEAPRRAPFRGAARAQRATVEPGASTRESIPARLNSAVSFAPHFAVYAKQKDVIL
jgi:hypothetical protein